MEYRYSTVPAQNVSYKEKIKDDYDFIKKSADAFIRLSDFSGNFHKTYLKQLYDAYNGILDEALYNYVTKPYGKVRPNFPARLRNFNILSPVIDLLLGEFSKRPRNWSVVIRNADVYNRMDDELNQQLMNILYQEFINTLNNKGADTQVESQPQLDPEKYKREYLTNYKDKRAIYAQDAINFQYDYLKMDEHLFVAFKDWLISGEVYSYKGVVANEVVFEIINPLDIDYDKSPDLQFVEDGDWVTRRKLANASAVVDAYYQYLTPEMVQDIETNEGYKGTSSYIHPFTGGSNSRSSEYRYPERLVELIHVCWKSRKKIGILTYTDEAGQWQQMEVDETYTLEKEYKELGWEVEWFWVNEVWEATRINGKHFVKMQPLPNQRGNLDNISKCKLPYNGRTFSNRNSISVSLVGKGLPYQITYNAYKYRLELSVAKAKDMIGVMDINLKPKDWDWDKWFYHIDAMGFALVDFNKEGVNLPSQYSNYLDLTNKSIKGYIELLQHVEQEWFRLAGITPQRLGAIANSELVGNVQRSVVQSSLITEPYFVLFDQFLQRELEGIVDYSKIAWINGKKGSYVMSDGAVKYFSIDPVEFTNAEVGIFFSNSAKDQEKLSILREAAKTMAVNGGLTSKLAEVLDSENFATIKTKIKEIEEIEAQRAQAEQELEKHLAESAQAAAAALQDKEIANDNMNKQLDRENEIQLKSMELLASDGDETAEGSEGINILDIASVELEKSRLEFEKRVKNRELGQKDRELSIKEKEIQTRKEVDMAKIKATKNKPSAPKK